MSNNKFDGHIQENFQTIHPFTAKMPVMYGVVFNPFTNEKSDQYEKFLIDTGSQITILRSIYGGLFKNNPIIRSHFVLYGGSTQAISHPVYKVEILIKGYSFDIEAVIDKNIRYSLLGQDFFKNQLNVLAFRDMGQHQWITNFRFLRGGNTP